MRYLPLLLLLLLSCRSSHVQPKDAIPIEEVLMEYPGDQLSVKDPWFFSLQDTLLSAPVLGESLIIKPNVSGYIKIINPSTFAFYPSEELDYDSDYTITLLLPSLLDNYHDNEAVFVPVSTRPLSFSISPNDVITYEEESVVITGGVFSSDWIDNESVEKLLTTSYPDGQISWNHSLSGKIHNYTISGIHRTEGEKEISLLWNNPAFKFTGQKKYTIQPKGAFSLTGVNLNRDKRSVTFGFSDPVLKPQRIEGLISIKGEEPISNYNISGSTITIFLNNIFSSQKEVTISENIKGINGGTLGKTIARQIQFDPVMPGLRLLGSGVITPYQEEVIFPFEAIGLNAVDVEIFKIFENNILQYLQNNRLDDRPYYLEQVGRIIHQEKVSLSTDSTTPDYDQWSRFTIDLQKLVQVSTGALYVVRIGFRRSYTNYPCSEGVDEQPLQFDKENPQTIMRWSYNYDGYNYHHESNPCYPAYYNESRFVQRNVLASNIGAIAKMGENRNLSVYVNDLRTIIPVANAQVSAYDYQQQLIAQLSTDSNGKVNTDLFKDPSFLIIKKDNDYTYLNIQDQYTNSLSDFDIGGLKKEQGIDGYIYGERGVWRPGDTIFLTFVLEDKNNLIPDDHPVSLIVNDVRGQLKYQKTTTSSVGGMYTFKVPTDISDNTGSWNAVATVGNNSFASRLRVETIKPNRLKIMMDIENNVLMGKDLKVPLSASWLHGAAANNLPAKVDVSFANRSTTFENYGSYHFSDPARRLETTSTNVFNNRLNSSGSAIVTIGRNENFHPPGKITMRTKTRVFEPSGEYSEDNFSVTLNPYNAYVGIKSPQSSWGYNLIERDGKSQLSLVVVDQQGNPLPNRNINIGLYEAEWQWWYSRSSSNIYRYDAANHLGAVSKASVVSNEKGEVTWRPESMEGYRYLVRACDSESGHCSGALFYTSSYEDQSNEGSASILRLSADKNTYTIGENVTLNIPSNNRSRILISVEGGEGIVWEQWYEGHENKTQISIPVSNAMTPNVYIHAMLLQNNDNGSDLPLRMYGVLPITVEDPATVLLPEIKAPLELKPKKSYALEISEKNKKKMNYTLAVVDEGLLGLTRFKTPDLHNYFYAKQSLGVKTWDVYDMVLQGHGKDLEKYISIGGDAELALEAGDKKANRFKPVVKFLGPFEMKAGEKNTHHLIMDNYLGEVRVMVVAKSENAYGQNQVSIPVNNDLMVLGTVPRVLSPDEAFDLPVSVFTTKDNIKDVIITVDLGPGLSCPYNKTQKVNFSSAGEKLIHFPVQISDYEGPTFVKIKGKSKGEEIDQVINIQVTNPNPLSYAVQDERIGAGETVEIRYSPVGTSGTNTGILELSTFPAINLENRLQYLIRYPYGCVEQTTSSVFPQLYLENIVALDQEQRRKINDHIQKGIKRIMSFQIQNGGLSYWKGSKEISEWGTSYAGHFLLEAQEKGYYVANHFWQQWASFQKSLARNYSNDLNNPRANLMQAYRLYTLTRSGNPEWAAMNYLRNENLDQTSRYILAAAYAAGAKPNIAQRLIEGVAYQSEDYTELSYTYGSSLRDKALVAESFLNISGEIDENAESLVMEIAAQLGETSWLSTQSTSFALLAVGKYLSKTKAGTLDATIVLNSNLPENIKSEKTLVQRNLEVKNLESGSVSVTNNSQGTVYARTILSGKEANGQSLPKEENLKMIVRYTDLEGKAIDAAEILKGTDFISEVSVTNPGSRNLEIEELALTQVFPSGWEIQNDRVRGNTSTIVSDEYDYIDIRDDRVNIFFDLKEKKTFRTLLTATYSGKYYLPDTECHAMYDPKIISRKSGRWVSVISAMEQ